MDQVTQFSVFLVNKPGVLAQVIEAIADAKVNIVALTIVDSQEHGVLRVVGDDQAKLQSALAKLNLPIHTADVLSIELPNRTGALATVVSRLAAEHVNIDYAYVTSGAPGGKTIGILKVDHPIKAAKVLQAKQKRDSKRSTVKGPNGPRARK